MIARSNVRDAWTRLQYNPATFMSKQVRKKPILPLRAFNFADLSAADTSAMDLHQHLTTLKGWEFDLVQYQRGTQLLQDRCFHLHRNSPPSSILVIRNK
jgi:hypothetical protein